MGRPGGILFAVALVVSIGGRARAQTPETSEAETPAEPAADRRPLAAAAALIDMAEFEAALVELTRALEGPLARDELVQVFRLRALANFAISPGASEFRDDLGRLLSLDPEATLSEHDPPDLRAALDDVRRAQGTRAIGVRVAPERVEGAVRIRAGAEYDLHGLGRAVWIGARAEGGPWRVEEARELLVDAPADATVEYFAELRSVGDTVLARVGSRARPRRFRPVLPDMDPGTLPDPNATTRSGASPWWFVGGGLLAASVAAIAVGISVSRRPTTIGAVVSTGDAP